MFTLTENYGSSNVYFGRTDPRGSALPDRGVMGEVHADRIKRP